MQKMSSGFVEKKKAKKDVVGWVGVTQSGGGKERSWRSVTRSGPSCMSAGG